MFKGLIIIKSFVMLQLKKRITLAILLICSVITYYSCSSDENFQIEKNLTISDSNFELLKSNALNTYESNDFSYVLKPSTKVDKVNYESILEILNLPQNQNVSLSTINIQDYKSQLKEMLGENYHEEYFNQLFGLYKYSETILRSDLFDKTSTLEQRKPYLQETLEFVFLNGSKSAENSVNRITGECEDYYASCSTHAEDTLGILIAGCTVTAIFSGIFSGGIGSAVWVPCTILAGQNYDADMSRCGRDYAICTSYNTD